MGVDAEMYVLPIKPLDPVEVKALSAQLAESYSIAWQTKEFGGVYALQPQDYEPPSGVPKSALRVNLRCRYYGIGYERGPYPEIKSLAEWLERKLPHCIIWYGGDNGAIDLFDKAFRENLFSYFVKRAHRPYHSAFGGFGTRKGPPPMCEFCNISMMNHGGSANKDFFTCHACNTRMVRQNGVCTEVERFSG